MGAFETVLKILLYFFIIPEIQFFNNLKMIGVEKLCLHIINNPKNIFMERLLL